MLKISAGLWWRPSSQSTQQHRRKPRLCVKVLTQPLFFVEHCNQTLNSFLLTSYCTRKLIELINVVALDVKLAPVLALCSRNFKSTGNDLEMTHSAAHESNGEDAASETNSTTPSPNQDEESDATEI